MGKFQLRLPDEQLARWEEAAPVLGHSSVSAMIRHEVDAAIARAGKPRTGDEMLEDYRDEMEKAAGPVSRLMEGRS